MEGQFRLVGLTETREDEGVGCYKRRAVWFDSELLLDRWGPVIWLAIIILTAALRPAWVSRFLTTSIQVPLPMLHHVVEAGSCMRAHFSTFSLPLFPPHMQKCHVKRTIVLTCSYRCLILPHRHKVWCGKLIKKRETSLVTQGRNGAKRVYLGEKTILSL